MIVDDAAPAQELDAAMRELAAGSTSAARTQVSPRERADKLGQTGVTLLVHRAPEAELRVIAFALERRLFDLGRVAHVLFAGEGSPAALAFAARACTDAGLVTICVVAGEAGAERGELGARVGEARVRDGGVAAGEAVERRRRAAGRPGRAYFVIIIESSIEPSSRYIDADELDRCLESLLLGARRFAARRAPLSRRAPFPRRATVNPMTLTDA